MPRAKKSKKETDIEDLVEASGHKFHCEVTTLFRVKGWNTLVSPYYMDGVTNKPREIDLIAERYWNDGSRAILIKLFIECKYIKEPTVFWFSDKDVSSVTQWLEENTPLRRENFSTQQHHYIGSNPRVAKLFAGKGGDDPIYKALNQSLNAMVSLRGRPSHIPRVRDGLVYAHTTLEMPVILLHSFQNCYRVEMEAPETSSPIDSNFQLEVNYAYLDEAKEHKSEYFLIDVIDFAKLESFLEVLTIDKDAIRKISG